LDCSREFARHYKRVEIGFVVQLHSHLIANVTPRRAYEARYRVDSEDSVFLEDRQDFKAELDIPIQGYEPVVIRYHLLLLAQAGLVDFEPEKTKTGRVIRVHVLGLSWAGHEFLDAVRSETVWRRLIKYTKDKGGALPFELLKALGIELLKDTLT
jgi:Hypothetical protein (DUF2513)